MVEIKNRSRICIIISAGIMLIALIMSLFGAGINYGIDFAGGASIEYKMGSTFNQSDVEAALAQAGVSLNDSMINKLGDDLSTLQVRVKKLETEEDVTTFRTSVEAYLSPLYPSMNTEDVSVSFVGPVASNTLLRNAFFSVLMAALLMLIYIAFRFDLSSGLAAVIGLVHDVLIMLSFMVILRSVIQMNSSFIAAMLTIVGYSINNTIVIFDRIRENNQKTTLVGKTREELVNMSIKQCLGRTVNTTATTLVTIVLLYVLGVNAIREFSLPIIVGILAGVYSANLINGYVWAFLSERIKKGGKKPSKKATTARA